MKRNLVIALAFLAGLLGGVLSRYIAPTTALAQDQAPITKEIRAQSFTLVDESNRVVGTFTIDSGMTTILGNSRIRPPRIVLRDSSGREIWSAGGLPFRQLAKK